MCRLPKAGLIEYRTVRSPMSNLLAVPLGGAYCQVPDEATAFGGTRAPCVIVTAAAFAPDPGLLAADRDWAASSGKTCCRTRKGQAAT